MPKKKTKKDLELQIANNGVKARDIFFTVNLHREADGALAEVTQWITTAVCKLYPAQFCGCSNYPCAVVSGTKHNNWHDDDTGRVENTILLVCHRSWGPPANDIIENSIMDVHNLVVVEEHHDEPGDKYLLCPSVIASNLSASQVPRRVFQVGVSGVSARYAATVWREIISPERDWMHGEGGGYMLHRQFSWDEHAGYHDLREMSCAFGWGQEHRMLCSGMDKQR